MPSLIRIVAPAFIVAVTLGLAAPAAAQSLSPMEKAGYTPSATKGFRLNVGNPYRQRMTFVLTPMLPDYRTPAAGAKVTPARLTLAPGHSRRVLFVFDIDPARKERTIALCITPQSITGPILPRVCGRYTGRMPGR